MACVTLLAILAGGCSPAVTAVELSVKVIGHAISDAEVKARARELVGQPVAQADATFGPPLRTLEDVRGPRVMLMYPVKNDFLSRYRWVIQAESGRIVSLTKAKYNPGGGKDIVEKLLRKDDVIGRTPQEIEQHKWFRRHTDTLRDRATGNLVRIYDVTGITDFSGGRYCVLDFDANDRCREMQIIGLPEPAGR